VRADAMLTASRLESLYREKLEKIIRPVKRAPPTLSRNTARILVREAREKAREGGCPHMTRGAVGLAKEPRAKSPSAESRELTATSAIMFTRSPHGNPED
jgi:hypothetical protein